MEKLQIGILHPGAMGISLAATAQNSGHEVFWSSEGRSPQTHARAAKFNLSDAGHLQSLCDKCSVIISVCPPHAAEETAKEVLAHPFDGIFADVNAVSPGRTVRIGRLMETAGVRYVDGGIIGGPAWKVGTTRLYLSGPDAGQIAACFAGGPLETGVIGDIIGRASALKMCYAANTKGTTALLAAVLGAADCLGVRSELETQWSLEGSDFAEETNQRVRQVTVKAWRFVGEMDEIAATFRSAGVPGEFHQAAAEIYRRLAHYKDAPEVPSLSEVLADLAGAGPGEES
ncbi:MAG: DUF1932 domain-containing protein [Thermaerobacterales bacterium]